MPSPLGLWQGPTRVVIISGVLAVTVQSRSFSWRATFRLFTDSLRATAGWASTSSSSCAASATRAAHCRSLGVGIAYQRSRALVRRGSAVPIGHSVFGPGQASVIVPGPCPRLDTILKPKGDRSSRVAG
ncbi:hypothetical protein BJV78DRAFT_276104 [Lactifluus subvellereus]|nr:hypothetical protein BJV78DRAFT_276104 [Lactifluus subvellereus]